MEQKVIDGRRVYAKIGAKWRTVYTTVENHSYHKVDYAFVDDSTATTDEWMVLEKGYLPCAYLNEKPKVGEGEKLVYEMSVVDGFITKRYFKLPINETLPLDVPAPRKFSKLSLETALLKRGLLGKWDAFLNNTFIPGTQYALSRFYDQANDLSEDHAMYESFKGAAKSALGVSDDEFKEILDESIWTG